MRLRLFTRSWWLCALVVSISFQACTRNLEIPKLPPEPGPGTISGTLVYSVAGRSKALPAKNATLAILQTSIETTADDDGRFRLEGITLNSGTLLIRWDSEKDGTFDRQRSFLLEQLKAGRGKDINLGEVTLGRNATLMGTVHLADNLAPSGHGNISVFTPGGPFLTYSGDNGRFVLEDLPEGPISITFFKSGYDSSTQDFDLRAGEEFSVDEVKLSVTKVPLATVKLSGTVATPTGAPPGTSVAVLAQNAAHETFSTTASASGEFTFNNLPPDVYSISFVAEGYETVTIDNVAAIDGDSNLNEIVMEPGLSTAPPDAGVEPPPQEDGGLVFNTDGGINYGPPMAKIRNATIPASTFETVITLDGFASTGKPPLLFSWSEIVSDGGTSSGAILPTPSYSAGKPSFILPYVPGFAIHTFALKVTDFDGVVSAPATTNVIRVDKPIALIEPTEGATLLAGATVGNTYTFDGSGSHDPAGLQITNYEWVNLTTGELASGPTYTVQAVAGKGDIVVRLRVSNGFLWSDVTSSSVLVLQSRPSFAANIVANPVAPQPGSIVSLSALIIGGHPSDHYVYKWTLPSFGFQGFSEVMGPQTSFTMPNEPVGNNMTIDVTLAVYRTEDCAAGVLCPTQTTHWTATLTDQTAPMLQQVNTGGTFTDTIRFNEPVTYVNGAITLYDSFGAVVPTRVLASSNQDPFSFTVLHLKPLTPNSNYTYVISGIKDKSPQANMMASDIFNFTSYGNWNSYVYAHVTQSPYLSNSKPSTGLCVGFTPYSAVGNSPAVIMGGIDPTTLYLTEPAIRQNTFITLDVIKNSIFSPSAGGDVAALGRRCFAYQSQGTPYWAYQASRGIFSGGNPSNPAVTGSVFRMPIPYFGAPSNNTWAFISQPDGYGTLFSDDEKLYELFTQNGLKIGSYDTATNNSFFPSHSAGSVVAIDGRLTDANALVAGAKSEFGFAVASVLGSSIVVYSAPSLTSTFTVLGQTPASAYNPIAIRVFQSARGPVVVAMTNAPSGPQISAYTYDVTNVPATIQLSSPRFYDSFDAELVGDTLILLASTASQNSLDAYTLDISGAASSWVYLNSSTAAFSNDDPTCHASDPQLKFTQNGGQGGLWAAWGEECPQGVGQWKLTTRLIQ